ncbi:Hypothetical_protein [Hexamita inflata]|uniref:Hypothetical_protein n=1 Tax=Hexamita inflata TaxID=28002 RepID=A0AA86NDS0_9EUKA|nr:Hypothetical protein HINF_LOCUS5576 [Hexamita inflata]CAI9917932.1 Hypothetical protein HINF_LOCUS5577 [Hexamita inflata]
MDCRIFSDNNWSASNRLSIDGFRLIMRLFHSELSLGVPGNTYIKELLFAIFNQRYVGFMPLVSSAVIILANFFDFSNFAQIYTLKYLQRVYIFKRLISAVQVG